MSDIKIEPFLESSTVEMYRLMEDFQEVARVRGLKRARQYAAAPDMYESLDAWGRTLHHLLICADCQEPNEPCGIFQQMHDEAMPKMAAALKKAEGKSE